MGKVCPNEGKSDETGIMATTHPAKLGKSGCGGGNSATLGGAEGIKLQAVSRGIWDMPVKYSCGILAG